MSGAPLATARPRVSVVVPAFNAAPFLLACLDSLAAQTFADFEVVAADDGSQDGTREILDAAAERDPRIRLFHNPANLGPGETRRRLVEQARAELVVFQDADDLSLPRRLETQLAAFERDPSLVLCGCACRYRLPGGRIGADVVKPLARAEILAAARETIPYTCATIMVRREAVLAVGSFRAYFNRLCCEDFDLALRITEQYPACNLPDVLYEYRVTPSSVSKNPKDARQAVVEDIVRTLAAERQSGGADSLERGDLVRLREIEERLLAPFRADRSLYGRRMAGALLSIGDRRGALRNAWAAIRAEPGRLANYRAWLYCLRKRRTRG